jgi:hypothetical protein
LHAAGVYRASLALSGGVESGLLLDWIMDDFRPGILDQRVFADFFNKRNSLADLNLSDPIEDSVSYIDGKQLQVFFDVPGGFV